ncbi:MAG: DinB family protein [Phototrophicaceae bacterium]
MKLDDIKLMFNYNYWANQQILAQAAKLSTAELYAPTSVSWNSLGGTLIHTMDAEYGWRVMLDTRGSTPLLTPDDFSDLDAIIQRWQIEETAMWDYLNRLSDKNINDMIHYSGDGYSRSRIVWHCLLHVVNHGTQHRSECAVMLTNLGHSPGEIDFTVYLNDA